MKFPDWTLPNNRLTASSSSFLSFFFLFFNSYIQLSYFRAVETVRGKSASSLITNGGKSRARISSTFPVTRSRDSPIASSIIPGTNLFSDTNADSAGKRIGSKQPRNDLRINANALFKSKKKLKIVEHANNFFNIKFIYRKWNI